jgi:hypothetical protein
MDRLRPNGMPPLSLSLAPVSHLHEGRLLLSVALQYLFVAASILIGGLAGRRRNETGSLRASPIFKSHGITYLTIYIEKTIQDVDGVPVPELVEHAVRVLDELSKEARKENKSHWLFQFTTKLADDQTLEVDIEFGNNLLSFVNFCDLDPPPGQAVWKLTYHMLRKGFVIASFHGNLWSSFDATNRSLRHWGAESSRHYMDDEETGALSHLRSEVTRLTKIELADLDPSTEEYLKNATKALQTHDTRRRIFNEGRQEFFVEMHMAVFDGVENPIGKGAAFILDALNEMTERAYARMRVAVVPTNGPIDVRPDVLREVKAAAADGFLYPVPGVPLYCNYRKQPQDLPSLANCHRLEVGKRAPWRQDGAADEVSSRSWPDYAFSSLFTCLGCEFSVLFNANQDEVQHIIEDRATAVPLSATASLAEDAQRYVDDLIRLVTGAREAVDGKRRS